MYDNAFKIKKPIYSRLNTPKIKISLFKCLLHKSNNASGLHGLRVPPSPQMHFVLKSRPYLLNYV